jgi:hypothetical protein
MAARFGGAFGGRASLVPTVNLAGAHGGGGGRTPSSARVSGGTMGVVRGGRVRGGSDDVGGADGALGGGSGATDDAETSRMRAITRLTLERERSRRDTLGGLSRAVSTRGTSGPVRVRPVRGPPSRVRHVAIDPAPAPRAGRRGGHTECGGGARRC